jgi:hypothetical protein
MDIFGDKLKNLQEVRAVKGGLIAADPDLVKFFLSGNG